MVMDSDVDNPFDNALLVERHERGDDPPPYVDVPPAPELEGPGLQYEEDIGWDAVPSGEDTDRYRKLEQRLYLMGYMASRAGNHYVYIDVEHVWHLLMSRTAQARICAIAGMKNVSTGGAEATSFFITWLTKRCASRISLPPQNSVCFGTRRLEVSLDGDILKFNDSRSLIGVAASAEERAREMCISPVSVTKIPRMWRSPGAGAVHNYIAPLFEDPRGLMLLKWHIGNCLLEPMGTPRTLMLAGKGGGGKSTILNIIASAMGTCCGTLPSGTFTTGKENRDRLSDEVVKQLVGSRMVLAYDVNLESRRLNTHAIKEICGEDLITDGVYTSRLICSVIMATNGYIRAIEEPVVRTDAIIRRMIVLPMTVKALHVPKVRAPELEAGFIDFLCSCVHAKLLSPNAPVYYDVLLASICHDNYATALELIEEHEEPELNDYMDVLSILHTITLFSTDEIIYKVQLLSPDCIYTMYGMKFIKGLRPRRNI